MDCPQASVHAKSRFWLRRSRTLTGAALFLFLVQPLWAQPQISQNSVVNAASSLSPTVPGGAIAQGSIFTITGMNLGPRGLDAREFPLQKMLGGVRIKITTVDGGVFAALPLYVSTLRIHAVMTSGVPAGEHRLTVIRDGAASQAVRVKVVRSSIGIFTTRGPGYDFVAGREPLDPIAPGGRLTLWTTGLGPTIGADTIAPAAGELPADLEVTVGGLPAVIDYQGRSPCCAGLDQIEVILDRDTPEGCFVPVWATIGGSLYSNVAAVSVAADGRECWENESTLASPIINAPTGRLELTRTTVRQPAGETVSHTAQARYQSPLDGEPFLSGLGSDDPFLPPPGSCLPQEKPVVLGGPPFSMRLVGPAEYRLTGPSGQFQLSRVIPFANSVFARGSLRADPELSLLPGDYELMSQGSTDFPDFSARAEFHAAPIVDFEVQGDGDPRVRGLRLEWAGGHPDDVANIEGGATCARDFDFCVASRQDAGRIPAPIPDLFTCRASVASTGFTIPPAILANLEDRTIGAWVTSFAPPSPMEFETDGPETGLVTIRHAQGAAVSIGLPQLASTPITLPNGARIQAELAVSGAEVQRGLMFRPTLASDQGMLFFFNSAAVWRFWMLNTLIPLDIIWMNSDREILFINADTPICEQQPCPTYGPNQRSRYVLELAAGEAARRGLRPGDRLDW